MFFPQQQSKRDRAKPTALPDPQHLPPLTTPTLPLGLPSPAQLQTPSWGTMLWGALLHTS